MTIGGTVCVRNGTQFDYCWQEAVESLLPICAHIVVCNSDSTDDTSDRISDLCAKHPNVTRANYPWTDPVGDAEWFPRWINFAREKLETEWHLALDADEVVHEDDYATIMTAAVHGKPAFCKRLNFWRNPQSLIPNGHCVGSKVLRLAPSNMPIGTDIPYEPAAPTEALAVESGIRIFHYGFLRDPKAFLAKSKAVQRMFIGSFDSRLAAAEQRDGHWVDTPNLNEWGDKLDKYSGTHPKVIHQWLIDRGYQL